ncbi:MAG: aspartate/glutamate racemase family protein [Marinibacterium sp.]
MRILLINPNTTPGMTDQMAGVARRVAGPGVTLVPVTAKRGVPYTTSRAEAQIAGAEVLDIIAEHRRGADAAVIAAFGDPGIIAARELFDMPVIGMAEAALVTAALMGERFAVVTFSPTVKLWYMDCVNLTGLSTRFTGVLCPQEPPARIDTVIGDLRADLVALTNRAIAENGADVVILGGAPLAGLAAMIADETPGLLVDPISAATVQAIALSRLAPSYASRTARPAPKSSRGIGPALAAIIAGETT